MHTHGAGRRSEIEKPRGSRTAPGRAKGLEESRAGPSGGGGRERERLRSSLSGLVTVHYLTSLDAHLSLPPLQSYLSHGNLSQL